MTPLPNSYDWKNAVIDMVQAVFIIVVVLPLMLIGFVLSVAVGCIRDGWGEGTKWYKKWGDNLDASS